MIRVTKTDGRPYILNADWIQSVESTPDTVITLTTGAKVLVSETEAEVIDAVMEYKREIFHSSGEKKARSQRKLEVRK